MPEDDQLAEVRLEVIESDEIESLVIGFRKDGELYELAEVDPPGIVTLDGSPSE